MPSSSASSTESVWAASSSARVVWGSSSRTGRREGSRRRTSSSSCSASGTSSAARGSSHAAGGDARRARRRGRDRRRSPRTRDRRADARPARDRRPALRPPRHAVGDEDRARDLRPRRVRGGVGGRRPVGRRDARAPPHPADGRERSVGDLPRRPRRCRARLEEPSRRRSGRVARARDEARRRHRRLGFLAFGALVGLALASALAVFAFSQRSDAREQARVAKGGQLVASALSLLGSDPELALAFGARGGARRPDVSGRRTPCAMRSTASRERAIVDVGHPLVVPGVDRTGSRALVVDADREPA